MIVQPQEVGTRAADPTYNRDRADQLRKELDVFQRDLVELGTLTRWLLSGWVALVIWLLSDPNRLQQQIGPLLTKDLSFIGNAGMWLAIAAFLITPLPMLLAALPATAGRPIEDWTTVLDEEHVAWLASRTAQLGRSTRFRRLACLASEVLIVSAVIGALLTQLRLTFDDPLVSVWIRTAQWSLWGALSVFVLMFGRTIVELGWSELRPDRGSKTIEELTREMEELTKKIEENRKSPLRPLAFAGVALLAALGPFLVFGAIRTVDSVLGSLAGSLAVALAVFVFMERRGV